MSIVLKVSETGHLDLPEDLRKSIGIELGGPVTVRIENGEMRIRALEKVLTELQEEASAILAGDSVDRFLDDRRRDAAKE